MAQYTYETPAQIVARYKVITQKFVDANPFPPLQELRKTIQSFVGGYLGSRPLDWLAVLNEQTYPLIKRIYEKAANDPAVNKECGRELNKIGGMPVMQGCFYCLTNFSPLSIDGRENEDIEQANWINTALSSDWNGIGPWAA